MTLVSSALTALESEVLFRRLWEISGDGMRLTDKDGTIIIVNDAFCKIVERSRSELEGQPFCIAYHPSLREEFLRDYQHNFEHDIIESQGERERLMWNSKKKWLAFANSYLQIPGSGKFLLSVIKDITQRKKAELQLAKSEQRYRLLFNNANDAVLVNFLDPGQRLGAFIEVNDIACRRLLYSREELLKQNPYHLVPEKLHKKIQKIVSQLMQSRHVIFELPFFSRDHRLIPMEVSSHLFEFNNRPAVLSILRDITERKRHEQELKLRRDQLRNLASRLQFIREEERKMIAREIHDELGQVLSVLKIQVALLANRLRPDQDDLKERTTSIGKLIDQTVETVQRISAKLRPGILDELGLVAAIQWQAEDFQKQTGIFCKYSLPEEEIDLTPEQATAVFRIFQEALTNVARHAQAEKVSIFLRRRNHHLVLEITDNGSGISEAQINDSQSLGLLGMRERALLMGGEVKIHGVRGKGTNVKVTIPLEATDTTL
ncbi:MAG TPA: PAS domain-containing sensor histidine kinase [Caldithrix abyssi]|uniref:PAS domain-containing sensor histidine kinase n=1 Tax=Caldithrix abyssi TaxID=187145 RepID=A0A7V4WWK1_CALAY|nr:PAS domain-containing sensor histidine kinase [Caldithrix abyssi]